MPPKPSLRLAPPLADVAHDGAMDFEVLFSRYSAYVARLAARLLGSGDSEVDDVVQDVFWLASRRLAKIPDLVQARGWLATVTTRLVRRRLARRRFRALFHSAHENVDLPAPGPPAHDPPRLARLHPLLQQMPPH